MVFSVFVHGDFKKRFEENGWEMPRFIKYNICHEKHMHAEGCGEYECHINENANVWYYNDVFEKAGNMECTDRKSFGDMTGDSYNELTFTTKKGNKIFLCEGHVFEEPDNDSCVSAPLSEELIEEIVEAFEEYFKTEFSYFEVKAIFDKKAKNCFEINLYESRDQKENEKC